MKTIYRRIAAGFMVAMVTALIGWSDFSWSDARQWLEKTAMISAGMQQPQNTVLALSEQLHHANLPTSTTTTTTTRPTTSSTRATNSPAPPRSQKGGRVVEQVLTTGTPVVEQVAWANRSGTEQDIPGEFKKQPDITLTDTKEPQVLIMHTHTTEGYLTYCAGYYNDADVARTKDNSRNVVAVGNEITSRLTASGIGVIHDTTIHDSPQYTGAYSRSEETVKRYLEQYPTIQVVLDIHRDAVMPDDTTKVKPTVEINGRKAAQVMIIASAVDDPDAPHPGWRNNLRLALKLQNKLATEYPGLARPLSVVASRYNQHLAPGSLLIEVGTDANTVAEAIYSGELVAASLADVLEALKE